MDNQNTSAEDLWGDILEALFALDYSQVNEINEIEGAVYAEADLGKMYEFRDKCTVLKD